MTRTGSGDGNQPKPWELVLQIAGALSGLAGLVYVIGAATMWAQALSVKLPADIATTHETRSSVIALGVKGLVLVALIGLAWAVVLTLGLLAFDWGRIRWQRARPERPARAAARSDTVAVRRLRAARHKGGSKLLRGSRFDLVGHLHERAHNLSPRGLQIAAVEALLLVAASFWTWQALTVVVAGMATFGAGIRLLDRAHKSKAIGYLGAAIGALAISLGWQVDGSLKVPGVVVVPRLEHPSRPVLPYFGETSDFIYVGVMEARPAGARSSPSLPVIAELRRDKRLLKFTAGSAGYCRPIERPIFAVVHWLFGGGTRSQTTPC